MPFFLENPARGDVMLDRVWAVLATGLIAGALLLSPAPTPAPGQATPRAGSSPVVQPLPGGGACVLLSTGNTLQTQLRD